MVVSLPFLEILVSFVFRMPYAHEDCQATQAAQCPQSRGAGVYRTKHLYRVSGHSSRRF
jgi:hypothetical protein